jgi:glycosyltransferase involved in cell wall biosynthesis
MDLLRIDRIGYGLTRDRRYGRNLRRMLAHASRTIYATEFMRRRGLEAGAVRERAVLVRKGVDILRFRPAAEREAARSRLGLNGPVVLAVGALQRRKGYDTLIHAMQRLADLPWTVVICGDGPERHDLQRQAAAAGLHDRVRLIGPVSRQNIPAYFAAAELFVHPAVLEAAGNVILEALASGCPVVATASGGPTEYLVEGVTGFTVPVGDATRLAARIRLLLTSPEQRDRMGQAARANAEQNYAYPLMTAALLDVYRAVSREARLNHTCTERGIINACCASCGRRSEPGVGS